MRTLLLGAFIGAAATLGTLGVAACNKKDADKASAPGTTAKAPALPPQGADELKLPIADIDGVVISLADFQDRINKQSPYIRARYTSMEKKKEFLDNLVRFEVLAAEAKKRGLDQDPEVIRTMKQVMIQKLMKNEFDTRVKLEDVTEAEMKKFYDEHSEEFNKPEEVRASAIIVKDKATATKAVAEAKALQATDAKGFRDLVTKYSTDEITKARGGDLRYFSVGSTEVPSEVVEAGLKLEKTGDIAGPIATKGGFYIIKQTARRKALSKSYDEVKRQIQSRLFRDKKQKAMEDFIANLRSQAKVTVHEDNLDKVRVDTSMPAEGPGAMGDDPHAGMLGAPPMGAVPGGLAKPHPVAPRPGPGKTPAAPPAHP
jgi:peptidyl-prolyl cis-trans isomerase C